MIKSLQFLGLATILLGGSVLQTLAQTASVVGVEAVVTAESCGVVGNGVIDPDETVTVDFVLHNVGTADTTNVIATLQATGGVTGPDGPYSYGALLAGGSAVTNSYTFAVTGMCGGQLTATLSLDDNGLALGTVPFIFTLGAEVETTLTLTNSATIILNEEGSANPYPSTLAISNLSGTIRKVTATLEGFWHDYPEDIDIILVSPDGDAVSLIGADGGDVAVTNVTLTFDDDASSTVGAELTSGTYLPSGTAEEMNAPAPAPPYGAAMSNFYGGDPNGVWSLYVQDYEPPAAGAIVSGWSLSVTAVGQECCIPPYENTNCTVLISEYVEGTGNNKALEIYNPSLTPVDLDAGQFVVMGYQNGGAAAGYTIALTGSIPAQAVYVLANSAADTAVLSVADMTSGSLGFSGNDAVVLRSGGPTGPVVDSIGQVGVDPGIGWGTGIVSTAEHTLRRMATVEEGDTNPADVYDPAPEWDGFSQNTFDGLGTHTSDCSGLPLPTPPILNPVGTRLITVSNTLQFEVVATPTDGDTVTLTATNLPMGAVFYPTNELGTFLWTNASPTGTYSVTFSASDIDGSDEETLSIVVGASNAPSLVYLETFDDAGMWGGGVPESYNAKTFDNDSTNPVADAFAANLAVMDTVYSVTSNAWRLDDAAGTYLRYGVRTNLTRIRTQLARWDNSPVMDFEVRYSTDYGTNYTTLYSTNGDWFASDKTYQEWDSGVIDLRPVDNRPVWIEIYKISGERLLIDNFQVEYTSLEEAGTPPELQAIGNQMAFLGSTLSVPIFALASEGDSVTLSVSNLPVGAEFSPTNEAGTFYWPAVSPTGLYSVTFFATDKDGSDEETIDVTVHPLPQVGTFVTSNNTPAFATFDTVSGQLYQMEFTLDLITPPVTWTMVDSTNGTGGAVTLSDTNTAIDVKRYYRITAP